MKKLHQIQVLLRSVALGLLFSVLVFCVQVNEAKAEQVEGENQFSLFLNKAERAPKFVFAKPVLSSPQVIVTLKDSQFVAEMEDLVEREIAVGKNHIISSWLERDLPSAELLAAVLSLALIIIIPLYLAVRKHSKQLATNQQLLNAVMDNSFQFQGLLTTEGRLLKVNSALLALIGSEEADVVGRCLWDTPWWSHDLQEQSRLKESIQKGARGESLHYETYHLDLEGKRHDVDFALKPLACDKGEIQYLIVEGHDITNLIERERRLKESEQRFYTLFDESPVIMTLNETKGGKYIDVNRKFCEMNGVSKEHVLGKTSLEMNRVSVEEEQRLVAILEEKGKIDNEEIITMAPNGEQRHHLLSTTFLSFDDNPYALSMLIDITESRKSQEALRHSEEKYRHIFENSPIGIFRSTLSGRHNTANAVLAKMFGYGSAEEMLATVTDIASQCYADPQQRSAMLQKLSEGEDSISEQVRLLKKDGSTFIGRLFMQEDRTTSGGERAFHSFIIDITKEKAAEKALRESEKKLRTIAESVSDVIWELDEDLQFTFVSPSVEWIQGWSEREMLNLTLRDVLPSSALDTAQRIADDALILARTFSDKRTRMLQLEVLRKDGSTFWAEISANLIVDPSGAIRFIGITRDISERKKTEQVMIDAEKMMMISGLAAGMAHEINNPLGIVLQNAQNVERRLSPQLASNAQVATEVGVDLERVLDYLERREILSFLASIRHAGERATKIVSNMLAFSRTASSGRLPTQINSVIDKAIEIAQSDYDLKKKYDIRNIRFVKAYAPDLPSVNIEETEIEQVLINLFKNSAQAMAGQDISSEPTITITSERSGAYVVIRIQDNGPGMSPQVQARIFEPFFTTKELGAGTGLGLYVSYSIITSKHRGHLSVTSELGKGATFVIALPVTSEGDCR